MADEPLKGAERPNAERALAWLREHHWAIEPSALETILAIASREISDPEFKAIEAVHTRGGQPLEGTRRVTMRDGGVAVLPVAGPIFRYASWFHSISGATSIERTALDFAKAMESSDVSRIVLEFDSPGGEVSGVHEFARMVQAARGKKPITAYVSSKAASAAYWIAAAADQIVVDATAFVGSIGVIARVTKSDDKDVVEVVSTQSPNKRPNLDSDEGRAVVQRHVDRLAQVFVESVAEFRGVDPETVLAKYGQGGVLVGAEAVSAGMADALGSLESVIAGVSGITKRNRHMTTQANAPAVTRELIAEQHPAIAAAFRDEGKKQGAEEGAIGERARIQGVLSKKRPGHEALVEQLAFDGKTSPDQAAAQVLDAMTAADKAKLAAVENDANKLKTPAAGADPTKEAEAADKDKSPGKGKSAQQVAARAREIVAEKASKGITISAADAVTLADKE